MKNILMLNYEFPPLGGGQANANFYILKEFLKYKNEVNIDLVTSSTDKYYESKFGENIKIYFLDIGKINKDIHSQSIKNIIKNFIKTIFFSKKLLKEKKYDLVICWSYPSIGVGYLIKKVYSIPYISLLRGAETPFYEKKWEKLDKYIFKYLAPIFWKNSKYIIANSRGLKDLALKTSPEEKIDIIENGINLEEFSIEKKLNKNIFQILYVGRLTKRKGVEYLIKGFKNFSIGKNDTKLNIVGSGEEFEYLQNLVNEYKLNEKIIFHGSKKHSELPDIYNSNDIYVLPSENEGMSNTLLEAMASSMPIIITNVGGTSELYNENGWIIKEKDEIDITEKLELAYLKWKNNELEDFGKASFEIVKNRGWDNVCKDFLDKIIEE